MRIDQQAGVFGGGVKYISRSALASVELILLEPPFSEKIGRGLRFCGAHYCPILRFMLFACDE